VSRDRRDPRGRRHHARGTAAARTAGDASPHGDDAQAEAALARARRRDYAWAVAWCAGAAVLSLLARPWFDLVNIAMLFLAGVVGVALRHGRGPAALASVLAVAAFDFFFVPPRMSFAVSDVQYLLTFFVLLTVGL
jgi:two-component system sensor histidine kinase KdpD